MSEKSSLTRGQLHLQIRKLCLQQKISLRTLSPDFRRVAEQCLRELLKVQILSAEHENILTYFNQKVPTFYRKCKGNLRMVLKSHKNFFEQPLCESSTDE